METNSNRTALPGRAMIAVVVASILMAVSVILVMAQVADDPSPAITNVSGFDGAAAKVGYEWWRAVSRGSISDSLTHPDSIFSDVSGIPRSGSFEAISVDAVPFGSLSEPQLCYLLTSSDGQQHTGSMVFRAEDERWLVWEIRPDVDSCYVPVGPDS